MLENAVRSLIESLVRADFENLDEYMKYFCFVDSLFSVFSMACFLQKNKKEFGELSKKYVADLLHTSCFADFFDVSLYFLQVHVGFF